MPAAFDNNVPLVDKDELLKTARALQSLLEKYAAEDPEAMRLLRVMTRDLQDALAGRIKYAVDHPTPEAGRMFYDEGDLAGRYPGLEDAFAEFRMELRGGKKVFQEISDYVATILPKDTER